MAPSLPECFIQSFGFVHYTAFHKYVPKYGITVYVVVEKRLDNGTFFYNRYTNKKDTWDRENRER